MEDLNGFFKKIFLNPLTFAPIFNKFTDVWPVLGDGNAGKSKPVQTFLILPFSSHPTLHKSQPKSHFIIGKNIIEGEKTRGKPGIKFLLSKGLAQANRRKLNIQFRGNQGSLETW